MSPAYLQRSAQEVRVAKDSHADGRGLGRSGITVGLRIGGSSVAEQKWAMKNADMVENCAGRQGWVRMDVRT